MHFLSRCCFLVSTVAVCGAVSLATSAMTVTPPPSDGRPPMPGMTHGPEGQPGMIHTEVFLDGATLEVELVGVGAAAAVDDQPVSMRVGSGFDAPFDVLNDRFYNAQFGWLPSSKPGNKLQSLPFDRVIAVQLTGLNANNPGPLDTYDGGNGMQLRPRDAQNNLLPTQHAVTPLFTEVGDVWLWDDFVMQHNWYAVDQPGTYQATYDVFVSDAFGVRDPAYGMDTITLSFTAVPEPASASALAGLGLLGLRRPRGGR